MTYTYTSRHLDCKQDKNSSQPSDAELEAGPSIPKAPKTQTARGTMDIVTPQVAAALDRTNISDRKAAHYIFCDGIYRTAQARCGRSHY